MPAFLIPHLANPFAGFCQRRLDLARSTPRALQVGKHQVKWRATAAQDKRASRRSLSRVEVPSFAATVRTRTEGNDPMVRRAPATLQVNIGLTCNQACRHCHVESSPSRTETMPSVVTSRLLQLAREQPSLRIADITGGAPELHDQFRNLVTGFSALGLTVIDRCNLTILHHPSQHDLVPFLVRHRVRVVASLPCYSPSNVEHQRGSGVFGESISALRLLNAAGYGLPDAGLELDLVYNPVGPTLPPSQSSLEQAYREELASVFGIRFNNLLTITNMPIKRFADDLLQSGQLEKYMDLLVDNFNPDTVDGLMCRDMIHVSWDGSLHDCDFNYALDLPLPSARLPGASGSRPLSIFDIRSFDDLTGRPIATGKHCYGCTAGSGSSCGGSLT